MACEDLKQIYQEALAGFVGDPDDEELLQSYLDAKAAYERCLWFVRRFQQTMKSKAALDALEEVQEEMAARHVWRPQDYVPVTPDDPRVAKAINAAGTKRLRTRLSEHPDDLVSLSYAIESALRNARIKLSGNEIFACELYVIDKPRFLSQVMASRPGETVRVLSPPVMKAVAAKIRADTIHYPEDELSEVEAESAVTVEQLQPPKRGKQSK